MINRTDPMIMLVYICSCYNAIRIIKVSSV